jgi:hypothetical protein
MKTMKTMKLLALTAATVVIAACNGTSPTSPNAIVASDDATALVESQALKGPVVGSPCRDITEVKLQRLRSAASTNASTMVEAIYLIHGRPSLCQTAPAWSSRPAGRLARMKNPFIVGVTLTRPPSTVQVTAEAPNGVQGSLLVR